ncbi:hypothetical protein LCGC14_2907490 [marine sediment metagenome]|uniref:Uncharacterized protein n=1 Tax=marine sediment metagenome TaxID=412755 RepID=A0A0F8YEE7_9ZZZZ
MVIIMENKNIVKGDDGKELWCWKCKRKIRSGELIYAGYEGEFGKFICEKCKKNKDHINGGENK